VKRTGRIAAAALALAVAASGVAAATAGAGRAGALERWVSAVRLHVDCWPLGVDFARSLRGERTCRPRPVVPR
jgi:hypothetical protein